MSLAPIVAAVGGDLLAGGARAAIPGPGHGPQDRSVSLMLVGQRVIVHCFAGDDWRDVLVDLASRGLVDSRGYLAGSYAGGSQAAPPVVCRPARERRACALGLWDAARPIAATLSARHLEIRRVADTSAELRHHPAVPAAIYAGRGPRRPALLAAIRARNGKLCGVEVTFLAADGRRADLASPRRTIGQRLPGSAVRLHPSAPRMVVGEGVFTSLSASARFGLPAWALMSAGNLRSWRPPPETAFVVVAGDRGRDGERSAAILAARLAAAGVRAVIRLPPPGCSDWNDAAALDRERE